MGNVLGYNSSESNTNSSPSSSKVDKHSNLLSNENFFGFENYGNTCYCNSVMQALYYCIPFRNHVLKYQKEKSGEEDLLSALSQLFINISTRQKSGYIGPKQFIDKLKTVKDTFRSATQQDAHEFLIFLLNEISDTLRRNNGFLDPEANEKKTFVDEVFKGSLTNETKCLCCETVTSKDEEFMDISIDIEQNTSITACLKNFSATETLEKQNKYLCENCCSLQEAQKRMKIKKLPNVLIVHLKRFKYVEHLGKHVKLAHRVVFPLEVRLTNTTHNTEHPERKYYLFAVVVHIGTGPNYGHYVCMIKSHSKWILFDDERVRVIEESQFESIFGTPYSDSNYSSSHSGYILFYISENSVM